jgi:hypothetical protein
MARVVVAGSRDVDGHASLFVIALVEKIKDPTVIMRRGRQTEPGPLEETLAAECREIGVPIEWRIPAPGGRDEVFFRDLDMVTKADLVLAVFSPERAMEGGTAHVIEKAIDLRVPAYAFTFDGSLERVGEFDPDETWSHLFQG